MKAHCSGNLYNFLVGNAVLKAGDIVPNTAGEERAFLGDISAPVGNLFVSELPNIGSIPKDLSRLRGVKI